MAQDLPLHVVISHFMDTEMLEGALDSITEVLPETPVHVVDGRHASFPGEWNITPATFDLIQEYPAHVQYHRPPQEVLPFGKTRTEGRYANHLKAKYVWYHVAPQACWALKMDADERLLTCDINLSELEASTKYTALIEMESDTIENARLWVPHEWTFYVDDIPVPRREVQRDVDFDALHERIGPTLTWSNVSRDLSETEALHIENRGHERSEAYMERREAQLATIE